MDFKVSMKDTRLQPDGSISGVYIPDVYDLYPIYDEDGVTIKGVQVYTGLEEVEQSALFASLRQRGSDPLNPEKGVMWAECVLGEISPEIIVEQIKSEVNASSVHANVAFKVTRDEDGNSVLAYEIQVVP